MGAYDLDTLMRTRAVRHVADHELAGQSLPRKPTDATAPQRTAGLAGMAWIAALFLIVDTCLEQIAAIGAVPPAYLTAGMIPSGLQTVALSAMVTLALTWMTATLKNRAASIALIGWAAFGAVSVTSYGWDPAAAMRWASIGLCAIAILAACVAAHGAWAKRPGRDTSATGARAQLS